MSWVAKGRQRTSGRAVRQRGCQRIIPVSVGSMPMCWMPSVQGRQGIQFEIDMYTTWVMRAQMFSMRCQPGQGSCNALVLSLLGTLNVTATAAACLRTVAACAPPICQTSELSLPQCMTSCTFNFQGCIMHGSYQKRQVRWSAPIHQPRL